MGSAGRASQIAAASKVPAVPGARGASPLPKPKASKSTGRASNSRNEGFGTGSLMGNSSKVIEETKIHRYLPDLDAIEHDARSLYSLNHPKGLVRRLQPVSNRAAYYPFVRFVPQQPPLIIERYFGPGFADRDEEQSND